MYIEGNWLNHINYSLDQYKNRVHGTTKMTPFEMSFKTAIPNLIPFSKFPKIPKFPKFQVGDFVSVPDKRNLYSKGFTTKWNRKLFKIHKINPTNPVTYGLVNENNEQIEGKYYEQELTRSAFNFKSNNKTFVSMKIFHKLE